MDLKSVDKLKRTRRSVRNERTKRAIEVDLPNMIKLKLKKVSDRFYHEINEAESFDDIFDKIIKLYFNIEKSHEIIPSAQLEGLGLVPPQIKRKPLFDLAHSIAAVGNWEKYKSVSYALQYKNGNAHSKIGPWSKPVIINKKMCPLLGLPASLHNFTRLVYRRFEDKEPQLIAVLDHENKRFRDVNRDVYNAASNPDEDVAMNELEVLLGIGGNASAVFENGWRPIHAAAKNGNSRIMRTYLNEHHGSRDDNGYTPLHFAVESDYDEFIEIFKDHVNSKTNSGLTPLHIAAYEGFDITTKKLIENGANITAQDNHGLMPVHHAAFKGFSIPSLINDSSNTALAPLHIAIINNDFYLMEELIATNANINATSLGRLNALHLATVFGDVKMVEFLMEKKVDLNAKAIYDWTPLHFAVAMNKIDIATSIANNSATDIDAKGARNVTPLHVAVITEQEKIVEFLVEKKVSLESKTDEGYTPLHLATERGDLKMVSLLIDNGADVIAKTLNGYTPFFLTSDIELLKILSMKMNELALGNGDVATPDGKSYGMMAAQMGRLDLLKYYVENDDGVFAKDQNENTLLHYAVLSENPEVVEYVWEKSNGELILPNDEGVTPFHLAATIGNPEIYLFLYNGSPSSAYEDLSLTDHNGNIALHYAAKNKELAVIKSIVGLAPSDRLLSFANNNRETPLNIAFTSENVDAIIYLASESARGANDETALHLAAKYGLVDLAKRLVEETNETRFSLNERDSNGKTPISIAFDNKHLDLVKYLIQKGSKLDVLGSSSFDIAIKEGNINMVKFLLQNKFDIETRDESGRTPLHKAVKYGRLDIVKYLVQKGAQVNAMDSEDKTPVHLAAEEDNLEILKYFGEETNADMTAEDNQNKTPLQLALDQGRNNTASYLESHNKRQRRSLPFDLFSIQKMPVSHNLPLISHSKADIKPAPSQITPDVNGTLLFFDIFIRKMTGRKYVCNSGPMPSSEAHACALNIVEEFEEIMKASGSQNFDFYKIYKEIVSKVLACKFNEISPLLTSYARKSGIEFEEFKRFMAELERQERKKKRQGDGIRCWLKFNEVK